MGMATDLKRVKGKCNVYRLQQDLHAWNVDGSSTDQLPQTSWIKYWERMSGLGRRRCAFSDCDRGAEHGGHVWIKGHASQKRGVWIAPICKQCNYCENPNRQRDAHGQHSFLRKGTVVVRTEYTPDMASAERRVSFYDDGGGYDSDDYDDDDWEEQICEDCGFDLPFGTPKHHTKCPDCFRRGGPPPGLCSFFVNGRQVTEAEYRTLQASRKAGWTSHEDAAAMNAMVATADPIPFRAGEWQNDETLPESTARRSSVGNVVQRARGRRCVGCGDDISDRPWNHSVCLDCYLARRSSGRRCEGCGDDISDTPPNHSVCLDCYHARRGERCKERYDHKWDAAVMNAMVATADPIPFRAGEWQNDRAGRSSVGGVVQRALGRRCQACGEDISRRPISHTLCYECYRGQAAT